MRLYLAGPLFSLAEKDFNIALRNKLEESIEDAEVILPQERAPKLLAQENGFLLVFKDCLEQIEVCDIVIAALEGSDADSGTCVEIGYAFAREKPIIGFRTDPRGSEDKGVNLMLSNICGTEGEHLLTYPSNHPATLSIDELVKDLAEHIIAISTA